MADPTTPAAPPADPATPPAAPATPPADPATPPADPAAPPADPAEPGSLLSGDPSAPADPAEPVNYGEIDFGEGVQVDTELLNHYAPKLNEMGMTAEQAKAAVPIMNEILSKHAQQQIDAFNQRQTADRQAISQIPKEDMAHAKTAMEKVFGEDPEAMAALQGRYGDLPWVVRGLAKIGKLMGEDGFIEGGSPGSGNRPAEKVLFPSMQK